MLNFSEELFYFCRTAHHDGNIKLKLVIVFWLSLIVFFLVGKVILGDIPNQIAMCSAHGVNENNRDGFQ